MNPCMCVYMTRGEKECVMGAITGNDNTVHSVSSCPYLEIGIHVLIIPHPS